MELAQRIESDLRAAMRARDAETTATLRMVLAAMRNARVETGRSRDLTDDEMVDLLSREAKRRSEAAEAYDQGGRPELADKEHRELAIVRRYLPRELDDAELEAIVDEVIAETGASGPGDLGTVMGAVMPRVKGQADGKRVSAVARERLTG